jgi:hypothetical protein
MVGFEARTAATVNTTIFWDVTPCSLVKVHQSVNLYRTARCHVPEGGSSSVRIVSGVSHLWRPGGPTAPGVCPVARVGCAAAKLNWTYRKPQIPDAPDCRCTVRMPVQTIVDPHCN